MTLPIQTTLDRIINGNDHYDDAAKSQELLNMIDSRNTDYQSLPPDWDPTPAPPSVATILHRISRAEHGWSAGITWYDGFFYETNSSSSNITKKNPDTGAEVGTVVLNQSNGLNGVCYDENRSSWWVKQNGGYFCEFPLAGGDQISQIDPPEGMGFGIHIDVNEVDIIYLGDQVACKINKVRQSTGAFISSIHVSGYSLSGIVKKDGYWWCGIDGNPGEYGYIIKVTMSGTVAGTYRMPSGYSYQHSIGGLTLDAAGYLWVSGGKGTYTYKVQT